MATWDELYPKRAPNLRGEWIRTHDAVEAEISQVFTDHGFLVDRAPYHATMKPETVDRISKVYSPGARYIRGRHDRVAIHKTRERVVPFEIKTNQGPYERLSIEALPLIHAMHTLIPTLYICRHLTKGWDAAFWTDSLPKFDAIGITSRCNRYEQWHVRQAFAAPKFWRWANSDFFDAGRVGGSGDAFCLIDRQLIKACIPDWRAEIQRLAESDEQVVMDAPAADGRPVCVVCGEAGCLAPHEHEIRWG